MYNLVFSKCSVTFEAGEIGSAWSFTNFDNGTVSSVMRRSRTQVYQVSTPATVGKFTAVATELHKPDVNLTTSVSLH
jgi:hypothetical protein